MKTTGNPTVKEFLAYLSKVSPCLLLFVLFYCIVHCYSYENTLVLIPLVASIFVLYYFFGQSEEEDH
ncbi:hypothetical protein [Desulforamulus putei]|uniref:Uncharacterized protein n=1 Tax=Desulforamulus putei DSM 12395 TaxID=1121429 RepID=A0A1M4T4R5_9FIRM|nr:hypothetical protein [Desulforamulus putei]SHE39381.1 hypothetical protein SAMN02745133_00350 [Desulforamulus putei DSM 12395]